MPLVVLCGTPLSGKSYRAMQLYEHLQQQSECAGKCVLVTDEDKLAEVGPNVIYQSAAAEKELRASLKSEVQRHLSSPETIVILDAANYIKGYRYELYCISKQFRTTHSVIECEAAPTETVEAKLGAGDEDENKRSYSREIFTELVQRFEQPDANNRWDAPLFRVAFQDAELPLEAIKEAILKRAALKPNQSTQLMPNSTDNFLYELDSQTQEVIRQITVALQSNQLRGIKVANSETPVNLLKKMPIAELNKLRRQFINYTRMHSFDDKERIVSAFVQFINKSV